MQNRKTVYDENAHWLSFFEDEKEVFGFGAESCENYSELIAGWESGKLSWNAVDLAIRKITEG